MDDIQRDLGLELLMNAKKRSSSKGSRSGSSVSNSDISSICDEIKIGAFSSRASSVKSASSKSSASSRSSVSSSSSSSSSSGSSSNSTSSSTLSSVSIDVKKKLSQEDIINMKKELLYQFDRLEKKGIKIPKKFTLSSSLEEMKLEFDRLKKNREVDISIKFQRRMLMTIITGVEFLNKKFDPFDVNLDGWSENINDGLCDYDDIFEELHEKYKGKANLPPELKLMFALGGSAFMFHLQKTSLKSSLAGIEEIKKNSGGRAPPAASGGGLGGILGGLMGGGGGLGGILGGLMGGVGPRPTNDYSVPTTGGQQTQMRGPTDVEDILNEINLQNMNKDERVELISTISESEYSEIPEDVFINKKGGKRTLNL